MDRLLASGAVLFSLLIVWAAWYVKTSVDLTAEDIHPGAWDSSDFEEIERKVSDGVRAIYVCSGVVGIISIVLLIRSLVP